MAGKSLRSICTQKNMPDQATVYRWLDRFKTFCEQYARAREVQADTLADEILDIADDTTLDIQQGTQGHERAQHEAVHRSKVRIDARKWLAGKLAPKKYGDKIQQCVTGGNGGPVQSIITTVTDPIEAAKIYQQMMNS